MARDKSLALNIEIPEDLSVFADQDMVFTILRNLVSNAIKFTADGGSITIQAEKSADKIEIGVIDSGVGMTPEQIEKLFSIGEHNKSTPGTRDEAGRGLGLILCQELVEKTNGEIRVSSILGEGSTFSISLPSKG